MTVDFAARENWRSFFRTNHPICRTGETPLGKSSSYLPLLEDKKMKVKTFSVRFCGEWKPIIVDELYRKLEEEKGRREFFAVNI